MHLLNITGWDLRFFTDRIGRYIDGGREGKLLKKLPEILE
jgi:hypothetical protein